MSDGEREQKRGLRVILVLALLLALAGAAHASAALLDPATIPKWENTITGPLPVYTATGSNSYVVNVSKFNQTILPPSMGLETTVYGYGGQARDGVTGKPLGYVRSSPGPSFEARRGKPITVKWVNDLTDPHMFPVDPTIMWANPNGMETPEAPFLDFPPGYIDAQVPVPMCVHLHGGEVPAAVDGGPDAWWTYDGKRGSEYYTAAPTDANAAVYEYPNAQEGTTLWYHDHALGITRLNVVAGLAGFYLLRDMGRVEAVLPKGKYEVPLVIQDRLFNDDGTFSFPIEPTSPEAHPYWGPEFFGDTIMVNGLVWPKMDVDRAAYRFRLLDGSSARFYNLRFSNGMPFTVVGTEGGFLKTAVDVTSILIAPGERFDVVVDFSKIAPGTSVTLLNDASGPFPDGDPVDPATTGQIMRFDVGKKNGAPAPKLPAQLNPTLAGAFPNLPAPSLNRSLVLTEVMGELDAPRELLLDGQKYDAAISELPKNGATEEWIVINPTADTHPIHLHLVQYQVVKRQAFDVEAYYNDWVAANSEAGNGDAPPWSGPTVGVDVTDPESGYLFGPELLPDATEQGWKDTVKMNPGEVTWIRVRFASQDGSPFVFDPTIGYYVWHCHILDHEDNEMMRRYSVLP